MCVNRVDDMCFGMKFSWYQGYTYNLLYWEMSVGWCRNAYLALLSRWQKGYSNLFLSQVCHFSASLDCSGA